MNFLEVKKNTLYKKTQSQLHKVENILETIYWTVDVRNLEKLYETNVLKIFYRNCTDTVINISLF